MKKILLPALAGWLVLLLLAVTGCSKSDSQAEKDRRLIQEYATSHNLNGTFTASGLYYFIEKSGSSKHPSLSSQLNVDYKGYFLDDKVFDQGTGVRFRLSEVIAGWQEGLPLIGEGGKIKLLIPSALAYGDRQAGAIPPNTVLGFDVTLNTVSK